MIIDDTVVLDTIDINFSVCLDNIYVSSIYYIEHYIDAIKIIYSYY